MGDYHDHYLEKVYCYYPAGKYWSPGRPKRPEDVSLRSCSTVLGTYQSDVLGVSWERPERPSRRRIHLTLKGRPLKEG